jgi:hypothetical protein
MPEPYNYIYLEQFKEIISTSSDEAEKADEIVRQIRMNLRKTPYYALDIDADNYLPFKELKEEAEKVLEMEGVGHEKKVQSLNEALDKKIPQFFKSIKVFSSEEWSKLSPGADAKEIVNHALAQTGIEGLKSIIDRKKLRVILTEENLINALSKENGSSKLEAVNEAFRAAINDAGTRALSGDEDGPYPYMSILPEECRENSPYKLARQLVKEATDIVSGVSSDGDLLHVAKQRKEKWESESVEEKADRLAKALSHLTRYSVEQWNEAEAKTFCSGIRDGVIHTLCPDPKKVAEGGVDDVTDDSVSLAMMKLSGELAGQNYHEISERTEELVKVVSQATHNVSRDVAKAMIEVAVDSVIEEAYERVTSVNKFTWPQEGTEKKAELLAEEISRTASDCSLTKKWKDAWEINVFSPVLHINPGVVSFLNGIFLGVAGIFTGEKMKFNSSALRMEEGKEWECVALHAGEDCLGTLIKEAVKKAGEEAERSQGQDIARDFLNKVKEATEGKEEWSKGSIKKKAEIINDGDINLPKPMNVRRAEGFCRGLVIQLVQTLSPDYVDGIINNYDEFKKYIAEPYCRLSMALQTPDGRAKKRHMTDLISQVGMRTERYENSQSYMGCAANVVSDVQEIVLLRTRSGSVSRLEAGIMMKGYDYGTRLTGSGEKNVYERRRSVAIDVPYITKGDQDQAMVTLNSRFSISPSPDENGRTSKETAVGYGSWR